MYVVLKRSYDLSKNYGEFVSLEKLVLFTVLFGIVYLCDRKYNTFAERFVETLLLVKT